MLFILKIIRFWNICFKHILYFILFLRKEIYVAEAK